MTRLLRIEDPGAIHHVISRGGLGRSVCEDEPDDQRLLQRLEQTIGRFGWDLLSCVLMPNHATPSAGPEARPRPHLGPSDQTRVECVPLDVPQDDERVLVLLDREGLEAAPSDVPGGAVR